METTWSTLIYGRPILSEGPKPLFDVDGDPIFDHAWQAEALGMAFTLIEQGYFSNADWSETLGAELKCAATAGQVDNSDTYYTAALVALETLLNAKGVPMSEQEERKDDWAQAYAATPHGQPVMLSKIC